MNINCLSPIALIKGLLPQFINQTNGAQIVNVLSVAGQFGTPVRSYYSASKFALDGFGKAIQGELYDQNIRVLQCYPAYVQTNISQNALVGEGKQFGKTDENIKKGLTCEYAVKILVKAMYLKRHQIVLGSFYYYIVPKLAALSENLNFYAVRINVKQQVDALKKE